MARTRRILSIAAGSIAALILLVYGIALAVLPKDWVQQQAMRLASRMQGGTVRWQRLHVGLSGFSVGATLERVSLRMPAERDGEARAEVLARDVFVRFRLLPLLFRRVEVDEARVKGAIVVLIERAEPPPREQVEKARQSFTFRLPRLEFEEITLSSTDVYGNGVDFRGLSGSAEFRGPMSEPTAFSIEAEAESVAWRPSARARPVALPSPFRLTAAVTSRDRGASYEVTKGHVALGKLESDISGAIGKPARPGDPYRLALRIRGRPQELRSTDKELRGLAPATPAAWSTLASWDIRVTGTSARQVQNGTATLRPVRVASGANRFSMDRVLVSWAITPDQRLTLTAAGSGSGVNLSARATGSTEPGGATRGSVSVHAPAPRLNGVIPNMPVWSSGRLEARASFELAPPAPPRVTWTLLGEGLNGVVQGIRNPVNNLAFHIDGDANTAWIRSFKARVGSTQASVTGTVRQGKPLGTGSFQVALNRFIAEEWADPKAQAAPKGRDATPPHPEAPPIPLRSFDAVLSIAEARSGRLLVRNIVAPIRYAGGNLVAAPIRGDLGTGTLTGRVDLRHLDSAPSFTLHAEVKRVPVKEFISGVLPMNLGLTGFTNGAVDIAGAGLPGLAAANTLQGALTGAIEEGKILETPAVESLRRALGLLAGRPGAPSDLSFRTLGYTARIQGGRVVVEKAGGEVGKDVVEVAGSVGFDRSVELNMLLRLASERVQSGNMLAQFASYARDSEGRLPIQVRMTGTLAAPKFSIRPASTIAAAGKGLAKDVARRILERARRDTSRSGGDTAVAPGDTTGGGAEQPRRAAPTDTLPEAIQKARDALERIFKR